MDLRAHIKIAGIGVQMLRKLAWNKKAFPYKINHIWESYSIEEIIKHYLNLPFM